MEGKGVKVDASTATVAVLKRKSKFRNSYLALDGKINNSVVFPPDQGEGLNVFALKQ